MILAALLLFGLAGLAGALAPPSRAGTAGVRLLVTSAWASCLGGCVVAVVAGAGALAGRTGQLGLDHLPGAGIGTASLGLDRLSGLFAVICFGVAVPALMPGLSAPSTARPRLPGTIGLTLFAVLLVLAADTFFVLLFGWELLTLAFYLLAGFDRSLPGRAGASAVVVGLGKASGASLLVGGAILAAQTGTLRLAGWAHPGHDSRSALAYALLLLGFGIKVGLVPVQVWLPPAYLSAPPAARAIMAGSAVNVGFYGMWRTEQLLGPPPEWLVVLVLVIGGTTALLGIAHAAVHRQLAGLVAWSSVENAGLITAAFGVSLVGAVSGDRALQAVGLLAGTAQAVTHALGKSLLFLGAAAVEEGTGASDLDALRGVARTAPWAGTGLAIGAFTLAGLPLTAGFASEWLILEALMQQFRVRSIPLQLACALAGALVALTVGVAGVAFVRLVGLTVFGHPPAGVRRPEADRAWPARTGLVVLGLGCLGTAAVTPLLVDLVSAGLRPIVGTAADGALAAPWVIQPVFSDFSVLSPSWLWIMLPALTATAVVLTLAFSGAGVRRVRRVPPWSSASPGVDRGLGYTSFAYANPMRRVLANVLLTRSQLDQLTREQHQIPALAGARHGPRAEPDSSCAGSAEARLRYRVDVVEVVERYLYRPATAVLLAAARAARRLQSGRLDAYLAYMLLTLMVVLAVVAVR